MGTIHNQIKKNKIGFLYLFLFLIVAGMASADNSVRDLGTSPIDGNINWIGNSKQATAFGFVNSNGTYFLSNVEFLITEVSNPVPNFTVYLCTNTTSNRPLQSGCIKSTNDFNSTLTINTRYNATFANITLSNNTAYHIVFQPFDNSSGFYRMGETNGAENMVTGVQGLYCSSSAPNNTVQTCGTWQSFSSGIQSITIRLWNGTNTTVTPGTINFQGQTPTNNSAQYYTNNTFTINTTAVAFGGTINTTHNIYYENGTLLQSTSNTTQNLTTTISGLNVGRYLYNATARNSTNTSSTDTRTITIYNISLPTITSPANNSNISRYLNTTWTNSTTTNNTVAINNFRLYLLNATYILVRTINTTSILNNTFDTYLNNISVGQYYLVVEVNDSNGNKVNSTAILFNHPTDSLFNITAVNNSNGASINTFTVNLTNLNTSQTYSYSTTSGSVQADTIRGHAYSIILDATNFAFNTTNVTQNQSFTNIQFGAVASNSINITIRDESTGLLLNGTTSITLTNNNTQYVYNTTTGNVFVSGILAGQYSASFSNGNYSVRTYVVTVTDRSTQNLNVYLAQPYSTTLFTITDISTGVVLPDTMCSMYSFVNGSFVVVESKIADVTGRIQWNFRSNVYYSFLCSRSGYQDRQFSLNNILFTTYNVQMQRSQSTNTVGDIVVFFSPTQLYNNQSNRFTWIIQSPNGLLSSYGFNITSACFSNTTNSGNNANGQAFQFNITLNSSCTPISRVLLTSYYTDSNGTFTVQYANIGIIGTVNAYTFLSNQNNDFGFGDFEKILIVTFIVLVVGGVAGLLGGPVIGTMVGLFIMWYFVMTGFIPASMIYVSLAVGVVLLVARLANEW